MLSLTSTHRFLTCFFCVYVYDDYDDGCCRSSYAGTGFPRLPPLLSPPLLSSSFLLPSLLSKCSTRRECGLATIIPHSSALQSKLFIQASQRSDLLPPSLPPSSMTPKVHPLQSSIMLTSPPSLPPSLLPLYFRCTAPFIVLA